MGKAEPKHNQERENKIENEKEKRDHHKRDLDRTESQSPILSTRPSSKTTRTSGLKKCPSR